MISINMDSVLSKVDDWKESSKGKRRMKSTIDKYVKNNVGKTQAGSTVLTRKMMADYGNKLIQAVRNAASGHGLPGSVMDNVASLKKGKTAILPDGSYIMELSFGDDLTRPSLEPERYGGVRNIIAIFNNGYPKDSGRSEAISNVYGWWNGEYMDVLQIGDQKRFYLMGDICLNALRVTAATFFNQKLYNDVFGDYNDLYELVLEGGNHAGFGCYGTQEGDGTSSLEPSS